MDITASALQAIRPAIRRAIRRVRATVPAIAVVTPLGWLVAVGSVAGWVAGTRLGWVELVLAAVVGLVVVLLSVVLTIGRTTLRVTVGLDKRRVTAGNSTAGAIEVRALSRRQLLPIAVELPVGPAFRRFDVPGLSGGAAYREEFTIDTQRRGVIPVGPATTVSGDPFGLLRRAVPWTGVVELFVHPVTVPLEPLGSGLLRDLEGRTTNDISMSDLAFHTLREYVPGDDRRFIHWRSSAKVGSSGQDGRLLVRQFLDTRRAHLMVLVDGDPPAYPDPDHFEIAVSAGASIAVRAIRDEMDTTAVVADQVAHDTTAHRTLDSFARAQPTPAPVTSLAATGLRIAPGITTALVITGAAPSFTDLRRVAAQFPPEVNVVALRVDPASPVGISAATSLPVLTLRELADLPVLLRTGGPQ